MDKIREIIRAKIKEISATSGGGASFSAGGGEQYATPRAFGKSKKPKQPNEYYKVGYKPVPNKIPGSGLEVKELFETEQLNEYNDFQQERIAAFEDIKIRLNRIAPLVSNAKNETTEFYTEHPGSYDIYKPTEMILSYLKAIETLLTKSK
jgi:hypothetical protein